MMNSLKYNLILAFFLFPLILRSQISNIRVTTNGEQIIIIYDYTAQRESIDNIVVTYTTGDNTEIQEATQVTGDLYGITPGKDKRIVWSPQNFSAENLVIHLEGFREPAREEECNNNLKLADIFFADKNYSNALLYYNEIFDCLTCNCNQKDIEYAEKQIRKCKTYLNTKDKYFISYLFDGATIKGGGYQNGVSAFLLRNSGFGYYASFRSNKNFYLPQGITSYYYEDEKLKADYELEYLGKSRLSSWLFSTGITHQLFLFNDFISLHLFGGVGFGANSKTEKWKVTERQYKEDKWITDGVKYMFLGPEAGVIANVYDYFSIMAGIKYPFSLTNNEVMKTKGLSAMIGVGIKLKSFEKNDKKATNTYIAYVADIPQKQGLGKNQSANLLGLSAGFISYHKIGTYASIRLNQLLFNTKKEEKLTDNSTYTGIYDYGNAFGTVGLTWMYFYGGIGVSYQREYKAYNDESYSANIYSGRNLIGFCTEFGINLRLFDKFLLRGGVIFPNFKFSGQDNNYIMGSNNMYFSLGLGYVMSSSKK